MSNEPRAGTGLDPELLAAYIDQRLTPEQRRRVEAQLANDPDNYAVLVETMKAMDANLAPQSRVGDTRRWMIAAGALAAAAVIALAVWMSPAMMQRFRGQGVDPRFEKLYASVDVERPIEGRLTGGYRYAPLRPVTRGRGADDNLALLAAAGELQRVAQEQPSIETQHAAAVALLLTNRLDPAVALLEQIDSQTSNARYRSDLAAAYAARAEQTGRAEDWARSLGAAERAIALDPNLIEAWFNRALALEKMFLRSRAAEAWADYLRHDSASPWAGEAKTHVQTVPQSWEQRRQQLDATPQGGMAPDDLVASNPQLIREWIEETLLLRWATAVRGGRTTEGEAFLKQAEDNAVLVVKAQPRSSFMEVARAIRAATDQMRVAQAHLDYLEARRLYLHGAYANSADLYQRAYPELAAVRSPLARTCQLYVALLPYFRGELNQADANLSALEDEFRSADPVVEGRRRWMLGIIAVGQGRYEAAVSHYRTALADFESSNESEGIAGVHSAMSEVLRDLGDREWWQHLRRSTEYTPLVRIGRRDGILITGTQGTLAAGLPLVARHYQETALLNASNGGTPSMMFGAFQWMYAVMSRLGEHDAAAQTLARARHWVDAIPDEGLRKRQEAELWSLEAEARLTDDPSAARTVANTAITQFAAEGRTRRLPQLYLQLARANRRLNDSTGAKQAIDLGLAAAEQQRVDVREARLRQSYFEEKWTLVEEGVLQRLDDHDASAKESLAFLDKWRRPTLFHGPDSGGDLAALSTLPVRTAVISYAMLPRRLAIWVADSKEITRVSVDVERSSIERLIATLKARLATATSGDPRETIASVSRLLIDPIRDRIAGADQIAIVPDGVIGEVPFAALFWPGTSEPLLERASVFMIPSIGLAFQPHQSTRIHDVLVTAASHAVDDDLQALPGAVDEARAISAIYGPAHSDLRVDDLTVEDFLTLAPRADVIHIAAHAAVNPTLPHLSKLFLAPSAKRQSGALTAAEISALILRAHVVVLSACDAGSGLSTRSEGVIGLASAFLSAGANSVVSSLWTADDIQSVSFQSRFHQALHQGLSVAEALRDTQRWARADQKDSSRPWQWATWIVTQAHF